MELKELRKYREMKEKYDNELYNNRYIKWGNMVAQENGYKKGYEKGRIETVAKIIKNMLRINMDISLVRDITGLSEEEISNINYDNK